MVHKKDERQKLWYDAQPQGKVCSHENVTKTFLTWREDLLKSCQMCSNENIMIFFLNEKKGKNELLQKVLSENENVKNFSRHKGGW